MYVYFAILQIRKGSFLYENRRYHENKNIPLPAFISAVTCRLKRHSVHADTCIGGIHSRMRSSYCRKINEASHKNNASRRFRSIYRNRYSILFLLERSSACFLRSFGEFFFVGLCIYLLRRKITALCLIYSRLALPCPSQSFARGEL